MLEGRVTRSALVKLSAARITIQGWIANDGITAEEAFGLPPKDVP